MIMATTQTPRGRKQDRARVATGQPHEFRYEAEKEGVSKDAIKDAVKEVGHSRKRLRPSLRKVTYSRLNGVGA